MSYAKETSNVSLELQKIPTWAKNLILILSASILLGLASYISIPLPFTPVPLALQPSLVLLFAILLGSKRATASVATFIVQGLIGFPVFAGGASGIATLIGPRGGYLLGYLVAAYVVGRLIEAKEKRTIFNATSAMLIGNLLIYLFGSLVLSFFIGGSQALLLGTLPFVLGDLMKIAIGLKFLQWIGWEEKAS